MELPDENDVVVDDTATDIISYSGDWEIFDSPTYHNRSLHITYENGANFSFSFIGQRFWYYSDLNYDHGNYSVALDGVITQPSSSTYSANIQFAKELYTLAVQPGSHTVTISNIQVGIRNVSSIDYFAFRPSSNEVPNSQDIALRPDDRLITYAPVGGAWSQNDSQIPGYHETSQQGASFSFAFEGEYVWYEWTQSPDHGLFSVSLDGGAPSNFSAYNPESTPTRILYSRALNPGKHTLLFTKLQGDGKKFGVRALTYRPMSKMTTGSKAQTTRPPISTTTSSASSAAVPTEMSSSSSAFDSSVSSTSLPASPTSGQNPAPKSANNISPAIATGAVLTGIVCVTFVMFLCIAIRRRRRSRASGKSKGGTLVDTIDVNSSVLSVERSPAHLDSSSHILPWTYSGTAPEGLPKYSEKAHSRAVLVAHSKEPIAQRSLSL